MRYCSYAQWRTRTKSTTPPKRADGEIDQARVEALLDDAAARCMGSVPGALIDGAGMQIALADLAQPLQDAVVYWSAALVDCWLTPGKECARIEKTLLEEMALALHGIVSVTAHAEAATFDDDDDGE